MTKYEKSLLDVIAYTEGTIGLSQNGYDVTVNFYLINGWTPDTDIIHGLGDWYNKPTNSTAAGRYQFLGSTWTGNWIGGTKTKKGQNVPMTKDNQDIAAIWLIKNKRNANIDTLDTKEKFFDVLQKIAPEWSSIPLTKTFTKDGVIYKKGHTYYDKKNKKSKHTPDDLWVIYKKALSLYS